MARDTLRARVKAARSSLGPWTDRHYPGMSPAEVAEAMAHLA